MSIKFPHLQLGQNSQNLPKFRQRCLSTKVSKLEKNLFCKLDDYIQTSDKAQEKPRILTKKQQMEKNQLDPEIQKKIDYQLLQKEYSTRKEKSQKYVFSPHKSHINRSYCQSSSKKNLEDIENMITPQRKFHQSMQQQNSKLNTQQVSKGLQILNERQQLINSQNNQNYEDLLQNIHKSQTSKNQFQQNQNEVIQKNLQKQSIRNIRKQSIKRTVRSKTNVSQLDIQKQITSNFSPVIPKIKKANKENLNRNENDTSENIQRQNSHNSPKNNTFYTNYNELIERSYDESDPIFEEDTDEILKDYSNYNNLEEVNKLLSDTRNDLIEMENDCIGQMTSLIEDLQDDQSDALYRGFSLKNLNILERKFNDIKTNNKTNNSGTQGTSKKSAYQKQFEEMQKNNQIQNNQQSIQITKKYRPQVQSQNSENKSENIQILENDN